MPRLFRVTCTCLLLILMAAPVLAQKYEEPETDEQPAAQPRERVTQERVQSVDDPDTAERQQLVREMSGMQVAIDPKTGKLRQPTPEESAALSSALRRLMQISPDAHRVTENSDGSISMVLDESFMDIMTVTLGPDGLTLACDREQPEDCIPDDSAAAQAAAEVK